MELALSDDERDYLLSEVARIREQNQDMVYVSFPGDEKSSGGCTSTTWSKELKKGELKKLEYGIIINDLQSKINSVFRAGIKECQKNHQSFISMHQVLRRK